MPEHRIFGTPFAKVYPIYVQKAARKNRTREEVDQLVCWLTGYDEAGLQRQIEAQKSVADFFAERSCAVRPPEPGHRPCNIR
ncbi:DUF2200 family protein [Massilia alkalitolerans]|uniref:DUF2200 family protein n=1 Tax=Massilia alkalitolerans TaxID=286638 RepID=UPI0009FDBE73|nr:DUF2200 family protein [Massilia alkalitolerans]